MVGVADFCGLVGLCRRSKRVEKSICEFYKDGHWPSLLACILSSSVFAQLISEINGNRFISQTRAVVNVTGLVTATGPNGFWLRSTEPDDDPSTSESIQIFTSTCGNCKVHVGDIIQLDGNVIEYRGRRRQADISLTEINSPLNIRVVSSSNRVKPLVIGTDVTFPPTEQYTSLDNGDAFGLPNGQSLVSGVNPVLQSNRYGLDYWEALSGELVTVKAPIAISKPSDFEETWVRGSAWPTNNLNERGGLTLKAADANPEAILIGRPLDGSNNPDDTKLGEELQDITGIVTYAFGYYRILPLTAVKFPRSRTPLPLPLSASFESSSDCSGIVIGSYNVENLSPVGPNLGLIAQHIVNYLHSPPLLFLQEIQDDDGAINDAVVSANLTLSILTCMIAARGGPHYQFVDIVPINNEDGGELGSNIRVAYLYNPDVIQLLNPNPGTSTSAATILSTPSGPRLNFNPARISPSNGAWTGSRKPLVAQWQLISSPTSTFFTINVHLTSKLGSATLHSDSRPPLNKGVENRGTQLTLISSFVSSILRVNDQAKIIVAGDFNEFSFVEPLQTFTRTSGLTEADVVANLEVNERYTYLFGGSAQALDHVFVSQSLSESEVRVQHVHVNTWSGKGVEGGEGSDHDPSVVRVDLC